MGTQCQGLALTVVMSVDKYSSIPSFLSMTSTKVDVTISMNPADTDAGAYTVRITFAVNGLSSLYAS